MRLDVGLDETEAIGGRDRLRAAVHAELREQVLDVGRDRLLADDEGGRDLALLLPLGEEGDDLALARMRASSSPGSNGFPR